MTMKPWPVFLMILTLPQVAEAQIPAFPGAQGAGMWSIGGRGGQVHEVTTLDDSGAGSLREAVEASGPRFVVFRLSGNIELASTLSITDPYIYIAGQTAPGDGITLKNHGLSVRADHATIRYLRVRPGDNEGLELDSISITEGSDIILDHCSASWSVDETLSASTGEQLDAVTVQWCIISESLNCSVHSKGCHGYASLIRGAWGNAYSYHHNLYAHHSGRNPRPGNYNDATTDPDGFVFDFRNNVVYNWGGNFAGYNSDSDSVTKINFVGNYYKAGSDSADNAAYRESCTFAQGFFADNAMNGAIPGDPWSLVQFNGFSSGEESAYKMGSPFAVEAVTTDDAMTAYQQVLANAGATLPIRDSIDARIVSEVQSGTGAIIDDEDEVGGWPALQSEAAPDDGDHDGMPDDWENANGLDPGNPSDGNDDCDGDGYTNIEEYLNGGPAGSACGGGEGGAGGSTSSSSTTSSSGTGGAGTSSGPAGGGTAAQAADGGETSGCGCRAVGSMNGLAPAWWWAIVGLWAAHGRRRCSAQ
jgi:pectate lyase